MELMGFPNIFTGNKIKIQEVKNEKIKVKIIG